MREKEILVAPVLQIIIVYQRIANLLLCAFAIDEEFSPEAGQQSKRTEQSMLAFTLPQ